MPGYSMLICWEGPGAEQAARRAVKKTGELLNTGVNHVTDSLYDLTGIGTFSEARVHSVSLHDCQQHPLRPVRPVRPSRPILRSKPHNLPKRPAL